MARREVEFSYVNTNEMLADMFTKPVPGNNFRLAVAVLEWGESLDESAWEC